MATPPGTWQPDWEYKFDQFGIRVPALLVSPWVKRGFDTARTQFDHTSVLKYLIEKWGLGALGDRTANANSIGPLINLGEARDPSDMVAKINLTDDQLRPSKPDLALEQAYFQRFFPKENRKSRNP